MKNFIPSNLTGKELFNYLVKNEALIFNAKKSITKETDGFFSAPLLVDEKGNLVNKAEGDPLMPVEDNGKLKVVPVINTTNWFDSHWDVHIPGLWKKSLSDNKRSGFYLLEAHGRSFQDVIAEECAASTKTLTWKELGLDYAGTTEALLFNAIVEKDRNEYMYEQYAKKRVKNHSVGMQYVKLVTCINDDEYPVQKENWDKYFPMVANGDEAEKEGFFWAVLEAKIMEGSAVLFGSNSATPTLETTQLGKMDSTQDTTDQPPHSTEKEPSTFDLNLAIKQVKIIV
jgi:hypothetical protein